jgi:diacylglycerol kinase family enzyme
MVSRNLILNTSAGSAAGDCVEDRLRRAVADLGWKCAWWTVSGSEVVAAARAAAARGGDIIIGGGDGSVSAVAGVLAGTSGSLGILPLGTRNHLAKDLGLPVHLEEALQVIARGHRSRIDVGQVNELIFVNNSSLGIYPRALLESQRLGSKLLAMGVGLFRNLIHKRRYHIDVILRDHRYRVRTAFVFVGNNAYSSDPASLGRRPRIDTGRLVCYLPSSGSHLGMPAMIAGILGSSGRETPWTALPLRAFSL